MKTPNPEDKSQIVAARGRPRIPDAVRKSENLNVRLTLDEWNKLCDLSVASKMIMSDYVRKMLGLEVKECADTVQADQPTA